MSTNKNNISGLLKICGILFYVLLCGRFSVYAQNINSINKKGPLETQINTLTGNFYLSRTDMYIPGRLLDIYLSFSYNSYKLNLQRGYGKGWSFEYDIYYKNDTVPDNRIIVWGNGREDKYEAINSTSFRAPKGFYTKLKFENGNLLLTEPDGLEYYFEAPSHKRITKIKEPNGNTLIFNYADTVLTSIVNSSGQTIQFQYNSKGFLSQATDASATPNISYTYNYDQSGNLLSVTDPLGGMYEYTYLVNGPMKTLTDKNNNTVNIIYYPNFSAKEIVGCNKRISVSYDALNKKTNVTDHMNDGSPNQVTTYTYEKKDNLFWLKSLKGNCCGFDKQYTYDENGNTVREIDANGNVWEYTYDERGNIIRTTSPTGKYELYTYSENYNKITSIRNFNGYTTTIDYDSKGNILKITEPENTVYEASYDEYGNLVSSTDPNGNVYIYRYNAAGRPIEVTGPGNYSAYLAYDTRGNLLSHTDGNGNETSAEYDILNRLKKLIDALDNSSSFGYDAADNLTSYTNPQNHTYQLSYDASNRIVKYTNPVNKSYSMSYTSMDSLRTLTNPYGHTRKFTYNEKNRLASFEDALGNIDQYLYDANGNLVQITLHSGLTLNNAYDPLNNLIRSEDKESLLYSYQYDANGNVISMTNSQGGVTLFKYDKQDRIVRITNELGHSASLTYDQKGNIVQITNENNKQLLLTYDNRNRLTGYTNPMGETISFTYDQEGNYTSVTDQNGNTTHYTYDADNRELRMTFSDGSYKEYAYDAAGNRISERLTDGSEITYSFNELNQVTGKNLPNGETVSYTYDDAGRVLTATNSAGTVTFAYDALDRVTSETFEGKTVTYSYNDSGRTQTTTYPDHSEVIKEYDERGRLIKILKDSVLLASYEYNPENSLRKKSFGNGVVSTYQYDFANRLSRISTGSGIQESSFTYDKLGNKLSVTRANRPDWSEQMVYDDNFRLLSHKKGTVENQFTYDALGNRLTANLNGTIKNYTSNSLNQLIVAGDKTLTYDGRGNLSFDGTYHKFYDFENRLIKDSLDADNVHTYSYDALGRKTSTTSGGITTRYTYAGPTLIEERNSADNLVNQMVFGDYSDPVMSGRNGNSYYYHNNKMGSVEAITNASGQVVEYYDYDTYGTPAIYDQNFQPLSAPISGNRLGFTGQEYDRATNSYRFYFRNYAPELGIFNQRDLIEYADGMGMYQYVGNNPANGIDIWGLCDEGFDLRNTINIPIIPIDDIMRDFGEYKNATTKAEKNQYLKSIAKNTLKIVVSQVGINAATYKLTGKMALPLTISLAKQHGPALLRAAASGIRSGAGLVARGAAAVGGSAVGATAVGVALPVAAVGLYGTEVYKQNYESDVFINSLEVERYMWEQGATDEERVERILKLSKIRKEMKERELRKRRKKNPCDDGAQDPNDPYNSETEYMSLVWSLDPNEIVGPSGVDGPKWVNTRDRMPYTIYCENDEAATAPARRIRITTPVEEHQDPTTLQLGGFGFNNLEFEIPAGSNSYYTRLDWRDSLGLFVDVLAGYDVSKNEIFWDFQAIDPVTLTPSEDPAKGVLLLRDSIKTKNGHGFVNFSMKPRNTAQTSDVIAARAEIVFDDNEMIPTNIYTNTLDSFAPESEIAKATMTNLNEITLEWSGEDDAGGVGISHYTIYTSPDGVNYSILKSKTTQTDTTFRIHNDGEYCFFILATDKVGNSEELNTGKISCVEVTSRPLPAVWLYFTAANSGNNNLLNWATAAELNTREFIIERSFDGIGFEQIGIVAAAEKSSAQKSYKYTDRNVDQLHSHIIYYRLKQIDIDGQYNYTNIVAVRLSVSEVVAKSIVFPNPTTQLINIRIGDTNLIGTEAQLFDMNGRLLRRIGIDSQTVQISLTDFPNGILLLRLNNGEALRIIKQ